MISSFFLFATITSLEIDLSEQLKWKTETRTIYVCKGKTTEMCWEFDEEGSKLAKLEWYFNDIPLISISSDTKEMKVEPQYQKRIEIFGNSSIRLKNISLADEGRFTLFPVFSWYTSDSMQTISLQVKEPPSDKCRGMISTFEHSSKLVCDLPSSVCGRPPMRAVWKKTKTFEVLGEGNYFVINSSIHDEEILCCPEGIAMDCADFVSNTFCTSFSLRDIANTSNTSKNSSQGQSSRDQGPNTDGRSPRDLAIVILLVICATLSFVVTAISFVGIRFIRRIAKINNDVFAEMRMTYKTPRHSDSLGEDNRSLVLHEDT